MRNPPGYGSVVDLGKNRRNPIAVRVPNGKKINKKGEEVTDYKYLGFFPRTKEGKVNAIKLLTKYNDGADISDLIASDCPTFEKLFITWFNRHLDKLKRKNGKVSNQLTRSYKAAFKKCASIHKKPIDRIKFQEIQDIADSIFDMSESTVTNVKIVINSVFELARKQKHIKENFISDIEFLYKSNDEPIHSSLSRDEVNILWNNTDDFRVCIVLIMIYTGVRIEELLCQRANKVCLSERYMIGGIKTDAGRDRIIPIAKKIMPFVGEIYNEANTYLLEKEGRRYKREIFLQDIWNPVMEKFGMDHLPHDTKYTCASMMDRVGVNENCKKMILGHARQGVTDRVYVQKDLLDLITAIDMI